MILGGTILLFLVIAFFLSQLAGEKVQRAVLIELLDGEGAGLHLADRIAATFGKRYHAGQIYPALRELELRGLVEYREEPRPMLYLAGVETRVPEWMKVRNVYRLTSGGRSVAKMWQREERSSE